ncbi:MAG: DNA/RNA nuclease SfsA [Alphaproteobacteria bacterium]|nr:DNA/RNA nuclease SfsA [Alphaproteobacteria bacterium]
MEFDLSTIIQAKFVKRYKRFFSDFEREDGSILTAHCPNTGSMMGLLQVGATCILTKSDNPKRKLAYTWQLINIGFDTPNWISVNTHLDNDLVHEALKDQRIEPLRDYASINREVKVNAATRADFYLTGCSTQPPCFLEVKHVHLKIGNQAAFPDSVTTRGQKHVQELMDIKKQGLRAVVIYVINRQDVTSFRPAHEYDPVYAQLFKQSIKEGVEHYAYACTLNDHSLTISHSIPIDHSFENKNCIV